MKLLALIFLAFATSTYASFDLKAEFDHLKNIAESVINNGNPQQIIKDAIQKNPKIQARVAEVCKISLVQQISFVKTACDYLTSTAAPVQKRDISSIVANVQDKFSQFTAGLSADLEKFKTVAAQIVAKIDVKSIIKTIVNLDLPDKITQVCAVPGLQVVPQVKQVCDFVTPIADQLKPYQQQAEQAIQNLRKRSVFDDIKGKLDTINGKVKDDFNNLKNTINNLLHNNAAAPAPAPVAPAPAPVAAAPAPVAAAPAVDAPAPVQKRDISAVFGTIKGQLDTIKGQLEDKFNHLKDTVNNLLHNNAAAPAPAPVAAAPAPVAAAPAVDAPAPVQKRDIKNVFNAIKDKVQADFNNLKNTIDNLLHNNAAAPAPAPVDPAPAPAPADDAHPVQKRGFNFGSFLQNAENVANSVLTGPLAQYKDKIDAFTKLAALVAQKPTPSPVQIIQGVVNLGLDKDVASLCSSSLLQSVPQVQQSCSVVVPLLNSASTLAQFAPGLFQTSQG